MFERAVEESFMTKACLSLFGMTEDEGDILDYIEGYEAVDTDLTTFKDIWQLKKEG